MSYDQLITFFESLVDDAPDSATEEVLADVAYTKRNDMRFWTFLMKLDSSITQGASDTWATEHSLPSTAGAEFEEAYRVFGGAGGQNEYLPVPFEDILNHIGGQNRYSIDYLNNKIRFTGGAAQTIYLWYKYRPTSLIGLTTAQKAATTTIVWPKRFVPIIAFDMAVTYLGGVDADDIARQQVPFHNAAHRELYNAMIAWDSKRRMKMFSNSASPLRTGNELTPADVIDMPI
jgi:hypothetical protein